MVISTQLVRGAQYEEILKGCDNETRRIMDEALVNYCNDEDDSIEAQKARSDKLKAAYNALVAYLVANRLNDLNPHQVTFLCTGAIGDRLTIQTPQGLEEVDFLPHEVYEKLFKDSTAPLPLAMPFPVMNVIDRFTAIAKGELLAFDMGEDRKKALRNSPADQKRFRDRWSREQDQAKSEIAMAVNQIDIHMPKLLAAIHETALKNAKVGLELMKKVSAAWSKGDNASPQEKAVLNAFEGKMGEVGAGMSRWTNEVQEYLAKIGENAKLVDEKYQYIQKAVAEIGKIDNISPAQNRQGPLFSGDVLNDIKKDIETIASVSVRPAETSPLKVLFSSSRILVPQQFTEGENYMDRLCTRENVLASMEKIVAIHTNLFPKDPDGRYIVPAICIEPLRNFIDFYDDRFIMALVSGESFKKGPFMSFTPCDLQVLRMCALFLTKDPIYDYRGDIKTGTFMGDYVGRVEKSTKVKWTGQEKKFSLAATSSMTDAASRDDAIVDYMDFIYAMVNGLAPNPKLSKRKINVLLKYVLFDKIEKNIAGILRLVAQTEPGEAKESILYFAKDKLDVAKDMIKAALAVDNQTSKMFSDNPDFAISRVFGRG